MNCAVTERLHFFCYSLLGSQVKLSVFGELRLSVQVLRITSIRSYSWFRRIRRWRNCLEKWDIGSQEEGHHLPTPLHPFLKPSWSLPQIHRYSFTGDYPIKHWRLYPYGSGDSQNISSFIYIGFCYICVVPELNMEIVQGKSIKIKCITFPRCFWSWLPILSCIAFIEDLVLTWCGCCHATKCQWVLLRLNTLWMLWMAATSLIKA